MQKKIATLQKSSQPRVSKRVTQITFTRSRVIRVGILTLILVVGIIGLTTVLITRKPVNPPTLADFPSQGQTHIAEGAGHPPYNSNPPTSGWHYATPAEWGIYQQTIPDEVLVHNLEHGGIWLSYRDADDKQTNKPPRRKQRGIGLAQIPCYAASGGECTHKRFNSCETSLLAFQIT